jgi:tetratricopeptide (TPR) repeat protein
MGKTLVDKLSPALDKMKWPENESISQLGSQAYQVGLDTVDEYQDNPDTLKSALRIFQSGDSRPYAFAGAAYLLVRVSRERDGSYYSTGLERALRWLEKAQELEPDLLDINMIEALIYIYHGRFEDARIILDYLESIDGANYYVIRAEAAYWMEKKSLEETIFWYGQAIDAAGTVPRALRLRSQLGDCYLEFGRNDDAVRVFKEAVHFSRENPWLWHKLSIAYYRLEDLQEAVRCNKRALTLKDFPEARAMEASLKEQLGTGSLTKRLFGR